jgi:hypothetical protein
MVLDTGDFLIVLLCAARRVELEPQCIPTFSFEERRLKVKLIRGSEA